VIKQQNQQTSKQTSYLKW